LIVTFQIFPLLSWLLKSYTNADTTLLQLGDIVAIATNCAEFLLMPNAIAVS